MELITRWLLLVLWSIGLAHAEPYPVKPVRLVVGSTAGGPSDIVARLVALQLTERLGNTVIVENRPGATNTIAAALVAKATPNGYTLYLANISHVIAAHMYSKIAYDPVKDFAPVARVVHNPLLVVVNPSLPVNSVKDLISLARARPGELNYATAGVGASSHLSIELLKSMLKISLVAVHYKGDSVALPDVIGGQVPLMFANISGVLPYVRSGKLRGVAVTSAKRSAIAPEFPTVAESGVNGFEVLVWFGVLSPPATPKEIITKLNREILESLALPNVTEQIAKLGFEKIGNSPEQFAVFLKDENAKWSRVVKKLGLRAD